MPTSAGAPPRTFADQLRGWSDAQLSHLLEARPDLAAPAPQDSAQLASRAGTRASVLRAIDQLTQLELTVLDAALALGGTTSAAGLRAAVNASGPAVDRALDRVRSLALVWGTDDALRTLSVLEDLLGTRISRLGPPLATLLSGSGPNRVLALVRDLGLRPTGDRHDDVALLTEHLSDRTVVEGLLDGVGERARAILDHLDREGKDGVVESTERSTSRGPDLGPVDQLLASGLLVARDRKHVAVPREVSLCLRDGHTTHERVDVEPGLATSPREQSLVDRTAAGAAHDLVQHVELLLEHWGVHPPSALRSGGMGVRDLRAAAGLLHVDAARAALHIEVAAAADLLATGSRPDGEPVWLPTDAFDGWTASPVAERWVRLASAWLESPRLTGLVGGRENDKPVNALAPGLERTWVPETRRVALQQLAALEQGSVLAAGTGTASLVDRVGWLRPRRPPARARAVAWTVEESAVLGVTALGGIATHGRALLTDGDTAAGELAPLLPEPVDHVLLQADLTAVAPGPLTQDLARRLGGVADVESRGGATVYRFTEASVRRAFDAGWSAGEVHELVGSASRTPVPQALAYLVDDVARRFGTLRVGSAEAFLRSDDEAALAALVHDSRAAPLRLRRLAPTVLVTDLPVDVLLTRLRELGTAPVLEAGDGTVRLVRREAMRSRTPRTGPGADPDADPRARARLAARVAATVTALRAGDRAADHRPDPALLAAPSSPAATLASLRQAVESRSSVWISYVDGHGSTVERVLDPVSVDAGWLSAYDHRTTDVQSFAVHRITAVRAVDPAG
jgi:hypothetical protein